LITRVIRDPDDVVDEPVLYPFLMTCIPLTTCFAFVLFKISYDEKLQNNGCCLYDVLVGDARRCSKSSFLPLG